MSDVHQHYCRHCQRPWEHDGDQMPDNPTIRAAHKCPNCGTPGWVKFYGNETHDEMCELEALLELSEDERVPSTLQQQAKRDFAKMAQRLHRPDEPNLEELAELVGGLADGVWELDMDGEPF